MSRTVLLTILVFTLAATFQTLNAATWQFGVPPDGTRFEKTSNISCGGMCSQSGLAFVVDALKGPDIVQSSYGTSATLSWSTTLTVPSGNWPVGDLHLRLTSFEPGTNTPLYRGVVINP